MTREDAANALTQVRDLVTPDGADLALVSVDENAKAIELQLSLDNVDCLDCVLPRDYLERLALNMFQQQLPDLKRVDILDPREQS